MGSRPAHCTGHRAGLLPVPRIVRGALVHQLGSAAFPDFHGPVCAWPAPDGDRAEAVENALQAKHDPQPQLAGGTR